MAPLAGKSIKGALVLSNGLFIIDGGLYCVLFAIGLGLAGAPIFLVASSCGLMTLGLETGTCFRSLVSGLDDLWSIPGVFRMDGDSACGLKTGR